LCFAANKVVRTIAQDGGMRAEPLTVTMRSVYDGAEITLGSRRPKLTRLRIAGVSFTEWSGHEIVHFPDHGVVIDPTAIQLSIEHDLPRPLYPTVAEALTHLRQRDTISAVLEPLALQAVYTVQPANYDYMKLPPWPQVGQIAAEGIPIVNGRVENGLVGVDDSGAPHVAIEPDTGRY
jgi:hypothetical protein